jgi:hypothetical protein
VKNNHNKKDLLGQEKPEEHSLQKEIEEMIDREKTKGKIVNKLLNHTTPSVVNPDH